MSDHELRRLERAAAIGGAEDQMRLSNYQMRIHAPFVDHKEPSHHIHAKGNHLGVLFNQNVILRDLTYGSPEGCAASIRVIVGDDCIADVLTPPAERSVWRALPDIPIPLGTPITIRVSRTGTVAHKDVHTAIGYDYE